MSQPPPPSRDTATSYLGQIALALGAVHEGAVVPATVLVWPDGLDRSILRSLPISARTHNSLGRAGSLEGDTPLRAADLLDLPGFGRASLTDLLLGLEAFLLGSSSHPLISTEGASDTRSDSAGEPAPAESGVAARNRATEALRPLLATAAQLIGTRTLSDAVHPELLRLAERMGLAPALRSIRVHEVVEPAHCLPVLLASRLHRVVESASERRRIVIRARLIQAPPATLEGVGHQIGVTRERVRQLQVKLEGQIEAALGEDLGVVAATLKERLDPIVPAAELERRIEGLVPNRSPMVQRLFQRALIRAMGFSPKDEFYIDDEAATVLREIRANARAHADDAGIVDVETLIEALPNEGWRRFWPWLRERAGLHEIHGRVALRDSAKARVKAALLEIGRPATRREIAIECGFENSKRVGAVLSFLPSVVRADKERWGLREWIDDEYTGIVGEIAQRIEEEGGATTTARLLIELPKKFGVSPASVRAFMGTPRFEIRDGSIRLANPSAVRLRHLDEVIHGRDEREAPYWTFLVEGRYFKGFSVPGVPPEFAKALGCGPDSGLEVRIDNLPDCRPLSLRWSLASNTGASLGYLSEPLRQLDLRSGDRARVTITGTRSVDLSAHDASTTARRTDEEDTSEASSLREGSSLRWPFPGFR